MSLQGYYKWSFLLICCYIDFVLPLKCFVCHSDQEENCENIIDDKYLKECDSKGNVHCSIIHQKLNFLPSKRKNVIRECAEVKETIKDTKCSKTKFEESEVSVCYCKVDGCNNSLPQAPIKPEFVILIIFILKLLIN